MLGGLHTEMAYLRALGDWLDCSGWVEAITNSEEIAKGGVAESFLSRSKVSKTRYVHQVTLCALEILLKRTCNEDPPTDTAIRRMEKNQRKQIPSVQVMVISTRDVIATFCEIS